MGTMDDVQNERMSMIRNDVARQYEEFQSSRSGASEDIDEQRLREMADASSGAFMGFVYGDRRVIAVRFRVSGGTLEAWQVDGDSDGDLPNFEEFDIARISSLKRLG